jgi:prepilin-type N-terminal cleavage/methylation domain-containing protein
MKNKLKYKNNNLQKGFTLIEILVVISILAVISTISFIGYNSFRKGTQLDIKADEINSVLKTAQAQTLSSLEADNYGVHFESDQFILFKGLAYDSMGLDNQVNELPDDLEIYDIILNGGGSDMVFERLTGNTENYGSIKIRIKNTSQHKTISVESSGVINVN